MTLQKNKTYQAFPHWRVMVDLKGAQQIIFFLCCQFANGFIFTKEDLSMGPKEKMWGLCEAFVSSLWGLSG